MAGTLFFYQKEEKMDFERFKEWALEDISSRLPKDYDDAELYYEEVKKYGGN